MSATADCRRYSGNQYMRFRACHHAGIAQGNDAHGSSGQWAIGGAHHEDRGRFSTHKPDMDWWKARDAIIKYMKHYCSRRHFKYNAASYGDHQGYHHDGWIGALWLKPVSGGC